MADKQSLRPTEEERINEAVEEVRAARTTAERREALRALSKVLEHYGYGGDNGKTR